MATQKPAAKTNGHKKALKKPKKLQATKTRWNVAQPGGGRSSG